MYLTRRLLKDSVFLKRCQEIKYAAEVPRKVRVAALSLRHAGKEDFGASTDDEG